MLRTRIATRYARLVAAVVVASLVIGGAIEAFVSHRERLAALEVLQREKAHGAAAAVSRFADDILRNLSWVALVPLSTERADLEQRRLDFLKLLRLEPAITTAVLLDAAGRERLRVSRIETDRIDSGDDRSSLPGYQAARSGRTHFAEVEFVAQSEPYLTVALPSAARDGSIVLAEVNLKLVRNVVSGIRIGESGYAYVTDGRGLLVSHPDLALVLQMTDLAGLPQVRRAVDEDASEGFASDGLDLQGRPVLAAYGRIAPLGWRVFVEQPRAEALAPLFASITRTAAIMLAALVLAVGAGTVAAHRLVRPIGALRRGAEKFGAGELGHRIDCTTGDELEELAAQFNAMASQLHAMYGDLERRVADRTRDLNERNAEISAALEQQTATAEILRVISSSPTDTGPVFRTIVDSAMRLCEASFAAVFLRDGGRLYAPEHTQATAEFAEYLQTGFPVDRGTTTGRAALARAPVQIVDVLADPEFDVRPAHHSEGIRTVLSVPMLRNGEVVGLINAWRREVRPFSDRQIQLLDTFARQAVIAIDNVRLFRELAARNQDLAEALEQQTAIAEVLRVISSSPAEAQPVFDSIVRNAAHLCRADFAFAMLQRDGRLALAARTDCTPEFARVLADGFPADHRTTSGRASVERRPVQILDFLHEPDADVTSAHHAEQIRTVLAVPMLRDGRVLGVIAIWRREVRPFADKQVKLLQTFADQAVIAVENLRLFNEIQQTSRELELANQAKSRFLAAASHDLRQPMHALSLFVGQLRTSRDAKETTGLAQRIEEAVDGLSVLLDQLLDLSRLEAGAVQAVQENFELGEVIAPIQAQFASLARAKGLELRVRVPPVAVRSDPLLVQRILLNLIANAIRYTDRGGVLIGARKRGDCLRIVVWDTGCGIPEDRHDDVFREFVQLGSAVRRAPAAQHPPAGRGLGLGLAIVARMAELLQTRVELRSRLGRGSMFAFELPRGTHAAAAPVAPALDNLDGTFVLVVDDDAAARDAMCGVLERWGCLTLAAGSADAAVAALGAHDRAPELIVCDYRLADNENGLDAVARLRRVIGEPVPALLVTAESDPQVLRQARAWDVPVLRKPVLPVKLRAVLAQLLMSQVMARSA